MITGPVPIYHLSHHHEPDECVAAFAAWHGYTSPLRSKPTIASCLEGSHWLWWQVEAESADQALALLPPFVAERSEAAEVREVPIP
jgi:hypothetical protein